MKKTSSIVLIVISVLCVLSVGCAGVFALLLNSYHKTTDTVVSENKKAFERILNEIAAGKYDSVAPDVIIDTLYTDVSHYAVLSGEKEMPSDVKAKTSAKLRQYATENNIGKAGDEVTIIDVQSGNYSLPGSNQMKNTEVEITAERNGVRIEVRMQNKKMAIIRKFGVSEV
jgi:hypothetical protein